MDPEQMHCQSILKENEEENKEEELIEKPG